MLKRTLVVVTVLFAILASPAALVAMGGGPAWLPGIENYALDGVAGLIGPLVAPEDTVYTAKYTINAWKRVRVGMSRREVDAILGPAQMTYPVDSGQPGPDTGARWSYSPGDTNFRCRVLLFRNGIVVKKHSEYYFD